jgi:anti-anti-sigma regulatory factor
MPFSIVNEAGRTILKLAGAMTISNAQELAAKLVDDAEESIPAAVETQDLTDIDTCILQLLYSLRRTNPALRFDNPSQIFMDAVDRCGLRRELLSAQEGL